MSPKRSRMGASANIAGATGVAHVPLSDTGSPTLPRTLHQVIRGGIGAQTQCLVLQPHLCDKMRGKQGEGGRDGSVSLDRRSANLGGSFRRSARAFSPVF